MIYMFRRIFPRSCFKKAHSAQKIKSMYVYDMYDLYVSTRFPVS